MVDKNRLLEELRALKKKIKSDPSVLAKYDLDGNGEISGDEWELARKAVIKYLENDAGESAGAAAGAAAAAAGGAADYVYDSLRSGLAQESSASAGSLFAQSRIIVQQQVEALEMVTSLEGRNRYALLDADGNLLASAAETGVGLGGAIQRNTWQFSEKNVFARRPFVMDIQVAATAEVFRITREMHSRRTWMKVEQDGKVFGEVHQKPTLLKRKYLLAPYFSLRKLTVSGPLHKPWSFTVYADDRETGSIHKNFSGMLRKMITRADSFLIQIDDPKMNVIERKLVIAAAIAIDLDYFENT